MPYVTAKREALEVMPMNRRRLLRRLSQGALHNVRFGDLQDLVKGFGGYIADIPDLESCSAFGETPEQALTELERAKETWISAAQEAGKPIPPPRYRPVIYQTSP